MMERGRVRWFNKHFGYGFITHYDGRDVFVHYSVIDVPEKEDRRLPSHYRTKVDNPSLKENEVVHYKCVTSSGGRLRASEVRRIVPRKTSKV
jgi:cold shock CspA family protein